jgi:23S rRNA pseudouridine2457 synthase
MHLRKYLVQIEGIITDDALARLRTGIILKDKSKTFNTLPAKVNIIDNPEIPDRNPPVRFRKNIPTSWIEMAIHEGKNRQVRKMTAAVGFPTLRLVRIEIENFRLTKMENSWVEEVKKTDFYSKLKLKP